MGWRYIQQDDNLWAVWSTIEDEILLYDATEEELLDYVAEETAIRVRESTARHLKQIKAGTAPVLVKMNWEEAREAHKEKHGAYPEDEPHEEPS